MPARDHIFECTSLWEIFIARLWNQSSYILPRKMKWGAQSLHTVWRHLYLECHIHKPQDYFLLLRGVLHVFPPFPLSRHCFFFSVQHFPSKLSLMCKHFRPSYVVVSSATSLRKMIMITLGRKHLFPFWAEGPCDFLILDKPPYYFFCLIIPVSGKSKPSSLSDVLRRCFISFSCLTPLLFWPLTRRLSF